MNDPIAYEAHSEMQRRNARKYAPILIKGMSWKRNEKILDFGCGNGYVTKNIFLENLEQHFPDEGRHVYALDICEEMIDFGAQNYPHPQITYIARDILAHKMNLPKLDKIFSFHCLQWVDDLRKVLEIFHDGLNPSGEIGFFFCHDSPLYPVVENLSRDPVWASYHTDYKNFESKTRRLDNLEEDFPKMLNSIGFSVEEFKLVSTEYHFTSKEEMPNMYLAVSPFFKRIPEHLREAYKESNLKEFEALAVHDEANAIFKLTSNHIFLRGKKASAQEN